jgi:DmsE family decaheme c-type cytochrome
MHRNRPVTRMPMSAAPGVRPGLRAFWMLMAGACMVCATAMAAPAPSQPSSPQIPGATFVGQQTCTQCHGDVVQGFAENPHTKMVDLHGDNGITCENCHGPGSLHAAGGGDVSKIFDPAKAKPQQINETCLRCHATVHPDFLRSPHAKAGLSCISCHMVHGAPVKQDLLKAQQPQLCDQCHTDVKASFNMPFHHPVPEGAVKCTDCHDVHGTFLPNNLRNTADQNMVCAKCHTDVRGPFVFEHMPVKAQGCLGCHTPHGSQDPRLLNMPNVNELCLQCHGQVAADTMHGISSASADSVPCTSCHTYIHGSNMNAAFLR